MKYIFKFLQTGGVPLTNDLMALIEEAYGIFEVLGGLSGNLTILFGCEETGSNVAPGILAIDSKLYYFEGGSIVPTVYIHTEEIQKTFEDQTTKTLIEKKTVRFGNGNPSYNWADFIKLKTLKEIQDEVEGSATEDDLEALEERVQLLELKTAPIVNGGIVWAWRRPFNEIPEGWKECIDIRGKTLVGLDPNDPDFATLNASFGSKTHKLTISEIPIHDHATAEYAGPPGQNGNHLSASTNGASSAKTATTGGDQPHNNVQPSRIVNFIEPNFQ